MSYSYQRKHDNYFKPITVIKLKVKTDQGDVSMVTYYYEPHKVHSYLHHRLYEDAKRCLSWKQEEMGQHSYKWEDEQPVSTETETSGFDFSCSSTEEDEAKQSDVEVIFDKNKVT